MEGRRIYFGEVDLSDDVLFLIAVFWYHWLSDHVILWSLAKLGRFLTLSRPSDVNYVLDQSAQSAIRRNIHFRKNRFLENRHEAPTAFVVLVPAESFYTIRHLNWSGLEMRKSSLTPPPFPAFAVTFCLCGWAQRPFFFRSILYVWYKLIYVSNGNFPSFSIKTISASYL